MLTHRQPIKGMIVLGTLFSLLVSGCATDKLRLFNFSPESNEIQFYEEVASRIEYPETTYEPPSELKNSTEPVTAATHEELEIWDMSLAEAIELALKNSQVIVQRTSFLSQFNPLLTNPNAVASSYDVAIQETNPFFGQRGVESALSEFDANFTTQMVWGRNERVINNAFLAGGLLPGSTRVDETGNFNAALTKRFANGDQFSLSHSVNYLGTNLPGQLFPSEYTGNLAVGYRHPILAGAGTEYTRIAGTSSTSTVQNSVVFDGVVIARINNDITIAEFERQIHNLLRDVETIYWDLNLAYHQYDAAVKARDAANDVLRIIEARLNVDEKVKSFDEAQARDQFFLTSSAVANGRSQIFELETQLRRLLGLAVSDGKLIRPEDQPVLNEFEPDWYLSLTEALMSRPEIRRQEWNLQRIEFQIKAAEINIRPRFDLVASYGINGFGDKLSGSDGSGTTAGVRSFYESLGQNDQTGWTLGFEFAMPIGFRQAQTAKRNYELRFAKAQKVLERQQLEIGHELAAAMQQMQRAYATSELNKSRYEAATERVKILQARLQQDINFDLLLRAQQSAAQAEVAYRTSVADYNKALMEIEFRKGTILRYNNVHLAEGGWTPVAYQQAKQRAINRTRAISVPHADHKLVEPKPFALPGKSLPTSIHTSSAHQSSVGKINSEISNGVATDTQQVHGKSDELIQPAPPKRKTVPPPSAMDDSIYSIGQTLKLETQDEGLSDRLLNEQYLIHQLDVEID